MSFPSRKRALIATLALSALVASGAAPSSADEGSDLKDKQKKVQADIKGAQAELNESSRVALAAGTRLLAARAQLSSAQTRLTNTQTLLAKAKATEKRLKKALKEAEADLKVAQTALQEAQRKVKEQRAAVGRIAADAIQKPDPHLVGLVALINEDDPADLATEMQTVGNVLDRQDQTLDRLKAAKTRVQVQERKVQKAKDLVENQREQARKNVVRKGALVRDAREQRASVASLVKKRASAQAAADRMRSADRAEVAKLKQEDSRIRSLIAARSGNGDFGNGTLLRPVPGVVTSAFGYRTHPIYGYYSLHDGTDFSAPCGTPLKAAGNGKVISEYYQSAWGNRLLLDLGRVNGHNITVIYNHLSSYRVGSGTTVSRGDTVGYAGTTGWSTGCHLHFTVMSDGKPVNPMGYF